MTAVEITVRASALKVGDEIVVSGWGETATVTRVEWVTDRQLNVYVDDRRTAPIVMESAESVGLIKTHPMTRDEAFARVTHRFTGIIGGLDDIDALLVAEETLRQATELLNRVRERGTR